ncbi:Uncharacterised protein [Yersinia mollaretii]|nr:Uncharacterised protein [Yersinia mollaretii]CQR16364.1 Uncharacterised protein [Yersinia mollaretii]
MFAPLTLVGVGEDAQAAACTTQPQTDTNRSAATAVAAVGFLRVGCTEQQQIACRIQGGRKYCARPASSATTWVRIVGAG